MPQFEFWRRISALSQHHCGLARVKVAWFYLEIIASWLEFLCFENKILRLVRHSTYEKGAEIQIGAIQCLDMKYHSRSALYFIENIFVDLLARVAKALKALFFLVATSMYKKMKKKMEKKLKKKLKFFFSVFFPFFSHFFFHFFFQSLNIQYDAIATYLFWCLSKRWHLMQSFNPTNISIHIECWEIEKKMKKKNGKKTEKKNKKKISFFFSFFFPFFFPFFYTWT